MEIFTLSLCLLAHRSPALPFPRSLALPLPIPHFLFDVTSSQLINAILRDTKNLGTSEPFSDAAFPKTDTSAAPPSLRIRRRQWLFNELALLARWHAIWIRAVEKVGNHLWRRTTDRGRDMEDTLPMIPTQRPLIADDHTDVPARLE